MPKRTQAYKDWRLSKLTDPRIAASYLTESMNDSPAMFRKALRNVAQARQMAKVAREAGVTRESLYRATSEIGNPTLDTLESVLTALGIDIKFEASGSVMGSGNSAGGAVVTPSEPVLEEHKTPNHFVLTGGYPLKGILHFGEPTSGMRPLEFVNVTPLASTRISFGIVIQQQSCIILPSPHLESVGCVVNSPYLPGAASARQIAHA